MPSDTAHPAATGANARYIRGLLAGYHLPLVADTPEAGAEHDQHLMDAVAALHPEDDFEAGLAVRIVAMGVHADDALRSAGLAAGDPMEVRRAAAPRRCRWRARRTPRCARCGGCRPTATRPWPRCIPPPWDAPATGS